MSTKKVNFFLSPTSTSTNNKTFSVATNNTPKSQKQKRNPVTIKNNPLPATKSGPNLILNQNTNIKNKALGYCESCKLRYENLKQVRNKLYHIYTFLICYV